MAVIWERSGEAFYADPDAADGTRYHLIVEKLPEANGLVCVATERWLARYSHRHCWHGPGGDAGSRASGKSGLMMWPEIPEK